MRVLLLVAHGEPGTYADEARLLDEAHALAIARELRKRGKISPFLAMEPNGTLASREKALEMPHRIIGAGALGAPMALWGMLRGMGGAPFLILAFGPRAILLGSWLRRLWGKKALALAPVFLLRIPDCPERLRGLADFCFCGSESMATRIADGLGPHCCRACVCQPGLAFEPRPPAPASHFVFGMAQSLEPRSGALTVVRAMASIWQREDLPPWEVRMYGGGSRYGEILSAARELGVASRLAMLHEQSMPEALAQCSAWLAPGSSDTELPATLWLGVACNLPVIASGSPLHLERLKICAGSAQVVPERDPQALAHAMIGLLCHGTEAYARAGATRPFLLEEAATNWAEQIESFAEKWS